MKSRRKRKGRRVSRSGRIRGEKNLEKLEAVERKEIEEVVVVRKIEVGSNESKRMREIRQWIGESERKREQNKI